MHHQVRIVRRLLTFFQLLLQAISGGRFMPPAGGHAGHAHGAVPVPAREPGLAQRPSTLPLPRILKKEETALIHGSPEGGLHPGIILAIIMVTPGRDEVLHQVLGQADGSGPLSCTLTHPVSVAAQGALVGVILGARGRLGGGLHKPQAEPRVTTVGAKDVVDDLPARWHCEQGRLF